MNLINSDRGYYLLQTTDGTCFLAHLEKALSGQLGINIAIALNSPVGMQLVELDQVVQATCLSDLGIKEVPVDFREMVSLLWRSENKTFWDYNWVLAEYFQELINEEFNCLRAA